MHITFYIVYTCINCRKTNIYFRCD